jgi:hypothetical protein
MLQGKHYGEPFAWVTCRQFVMLIGFLSKKKTSWSGKRNAIGLTKQKSESQETQQKVRVKIKRGKKT